jgi:hypothetical protein
MRQDWKLTQSFQKTTKIMTDKDKYIAGLRKARIEHTKWLNKVKLIVSGFETKSESVVLNPSDTQFGIWLETQAILFSTINSKSTLEEIELLHHECYTIYHKIYNLIFNTQSGLLSSLFGTNKPSSSDFIVAESYYEELVSKSDELINKMRIYENQVQANSTEKFDGIYEEIQIETKETSTPLKGQRYYRGSLISED